MKLVRVTNARTGQVVGSEIVVADRWWRRAVGLLGRDAVAPGDGLLLEPCGDVAFCDVVDLCWHRLPHVACRA